MKMEFDLQLGQSQKLIMTPQLKQAIQILQFTHLELEEYIDKELENNPVLDKVVINEGLMDAKYKADKTKDINWKEYIEDFDILNIQK